MIDKFENLDFHAQPFFIGQRPATYAPSQAFEAAVAFHPQGLHDQAEPLYRRALRLDRNHFDSLHNLGLILLERGSVDEAVSLIRKACYQRPNNPEAQNSLGVALQARKQPARAIEHHRKALAISPDYPEAHLSLGFALQSLNRIDEAISHYQRALAIRPDYAEAHHNLATALQMLDRPTEAIPHYQVALATRPDLAEVHHDLGIALQTVGNIDEAARSFEQAIALAPKNARFYRSLVGCKHIVADDPCLAAMETLAQEMAALSEEAQMELTLPSARLSPSLASLSGHSLTCWRVTRSNGGKSYMTKRRCLDISNTSGLRTLPRPCVTSWASVTLRPSRCSSSACRALAAL
jgi:tetratricopeptide (TPR) repeat protein